uniref:Uncharacterized protein n=1 Tax=Oryza brachyantha TaxID=4533 RepID=J3LCS3_ORYBR
MDLGSLALQTEVKVVKPHVTCQYENSLCQPHLPCMLLPLFPNVRLSDIVYVHMNAN